MPAAVHSRCALGVTFLLAAASLRMAAAGDWPTFRGAGRTAVSKETGLLKEWPTGGPHLDWMGRGAGRGYASLAIGGGRIFTLGDAPSTANDKDEYLVAFDRQSGKPLWKLKTGKPWTSGQPTWQSSRSTPTVDGGLVYVISPYGQLICAEADNGHERWRKGLKEDFGGKKGDPWGYSESPTIDGDRLICTPGGVKATMVALDKKPANSSGRRSDPATAGPGTHRS
jgi:outer membrane protein assembly factor BamB